MRIGIIGAGITGLAATHYLKEADVDVVTFEASDRVGGVIRSEGAAAHVREYGPQRLRLTPCVDDLVSAYGLSDSLRIAPDGLPLYVYRSGKLHTVPRSPMAFMRSSLLSWRAKARILKEPLTSGVRPSESAGAYLERKFGPECYRALIEPLLGGIYATDPREMPADVAIQPLLRLEERHGSLLQAAISRLWRSTDTPPAISFDDGVAMLPRAIADAHADSIRLEDPVQTIQARDGNTGYEIHADSGPTHADAVLVTVPAPEAASLLESLPEATVDGLESLTYNPLAIVHLKTDIEVEGFGYQVCRDEGLSTRGVTWNTSLFDRDGIITAFLGGIEQPEIETMDPQTIGEIARKELSTVIGGDLEIIETTVLPNAIPAHDRSWTALTDLSLPSDVYLPTNYRGRIGVPGRIRDARRVATRICDDSSA